MLKNGVILNRADGATLKNVKVITTKGGNNLKMQKCNKRYCRRQTI